MTKEKDPTKLKRKLIDFAKKSAFFELIGLQVIDFEPRWAKCSITPRVALRNPNGAVHGGITASLVDASVTQAMLMTDEYDSIVREHGGFMTTVDLRIRYLKPLRGSEMICEARIHHLGKRIVHASAEVKDDQGVVLALGESMLMLVPASTT